jgi:hypothetical protein
VRQSIQKAIPEIGQRDVGIIAGRREHGKGLDVNIGDVFLAGESVSANGVSEGVDDEICVAAGFISLAHHLGTDIHCMRHQLFEEFEKVIARIIKATTKFFGVASKWEEGDAMPFDQ